jgi:hypothetical protein
MMAAIDPHNRIPVIIVACPFLRDMRGARMYADDTATIALAPAYHEQEIFPGMGMIQLRSLER